MKIQTREFAKWVTVRSMASMAKRFGAERVLSLQEGRAVTEWRKLLAGALTASICLFGVTATADAAGKAKRPAHQQASRTEWDRKPADHPKLDRKLNDRSDRGGSGTSSMIVTFQPGM